MNNCSIKLMYAALLLSVTLSATGGKAEKNLTGKWSLVSLETSVPMLDAIIREKIKEKEIVADFTENGTLKISESEKGIKYAVVRKKKIKFSNAVTAGKIETCEADFEISGKEMKLTVPTEETKRLIFAIKSQYEKSGGEKLIIDMIANLAQNDKINLVFLLKRK